MTAKARRGTGRRLGRQGSQLAFLVAVVIAVSLVLWAGIRIAGRNDKSRAPNQDGDPGVSHVHGLGLNPADGALIVATHHGAFRIPPGGDEADRIGDSFQDTMGFTVAGRNRFLGSGHPDVKGMQAGQPARLGLIESADGGATWSALSLSG